MGLGDSGYCPYDVSGGPSRVAVTAEGVRRCCRENRWGDPPPGGLLFVPAQAWKLTTQTHPVHALALGLAGSCSFGKVRSASLWLQGDPAWSWAGRQGHCPQQALPLRPTERAGKAQFSAHPAADRTINLPPQLPALLQILSPPESLWNPARASSCPSPTTFYQHLGPEWPQGLRAADRTKPAQTDASPSPRGTGSSQATGPAAPLGCLLSWAQGQSCI